MDTVLSSNFFFANTPRHRGHDLAVWFLSHAFKPENRQTDKFRQLIEDTESAHPGFISSPVVGLTLFRSIQMSRQDIICCILSGGGDVNMMFRGRCMLHEAVRVSNEAMLIFLLSLPDIDKDKYDVETRTPLMEAARGRPRCLRILLEAGCDLWMSDSDGNTALHQALQADRAHRDDVLACLDILLEFGVDINAVGAQSKTCLQKAVEMGSHWLVKWFMLHNCNLHVQIRSTRVVLGSFRSRKLHKEIPLLLAFQKADRVLVEVLIACGCEFRQYRWMLDYCKPYRLLYKNLAEAFRRVDSLQTQCRRVIRGCLSTDIVRECQHLGLPVSLQQFVLCSEELKVLETSGL